MEKLNLSAELENVISEFLIDDFRDDPNFYGHHSTCCDHQPEPIEHKHVSGFIPFYNGGWRMMLMSDMATAIGSGRYPTSLQEEVDRLEGNCERDFKCEHPDVTLDSEKYGDYRHDWLREGTEFWYEIRIMYCSADNRHESEYLGQDRVIIVSGINTDYTYGRDKGLQVSYEKCIPVTTLTADVLRGALQQAKDAI